MQERFNAVQMTTLKLLAENLNSTNDEADIVSKVAAFEENRKFMSEESGERDFQKEQDS